MVESVMNIIRLANHPELVEQAASWFSSKWSIEVEAYRDSIKTSISHKEGIPQCYVILDDNQNIIAGVGIIENDFHSRKDLMPNLCALYVDNAYRKQNLARQLLDFARADIKKMGFEQLYLITDLNDFYERCGWKFLTLVDTDDGEMIKMYVI
jgi:N-acetylglutamate synthase-like GNAT family acetyltransferase